MNTVEKGDEFESKAFDLVNKLIEDQALGIIPGQCKVFKKKAYYSKDRESNIIFDIAIEVTPPNAQRPVMIWLIECKNYKSSIPINKIEDFSKKIDQVAGYNCKGVFIATSKLQEGGRNFCKNKGIMLIHVNSLMIHDIVLHRIGRKSVEKELIQTKRSEALNISDEDDPITKMLKLQYLNLELEKKLLIAFRNLNPIYKGSEQESIPVLSSKEIENIAESLLSKYNHRTTEDGMKILVTPFINYLTDYFEIEITHETILEVDGVGNQLLGKCEFSKRKITIDKSLVDTERYLFSLAHELGHFILHSKVIIDQNNYELLSHSNNNLRHLDERELKTSRDWIEWQANKFASNIAVPRAALALRLKFFLDQMGRNLNRKFYLDNQPSNIRDYNILVSKLAMYFGVSKSVINYRLDDFNFVTRVGGPKHIKKYFE